MSKPAIIVLPCVLAITLLITPILALCSWFAVAYMILHGIPWDILSQNLIGAALFGPIFMVAAIGAGGLVAIFIFFGVGGATYAMLHKVKPAWAPEPF